METLLVWLEVGQFIGGAILLARLSLQKAMLVVAFRKIVILAADHAITCDA